ncbi:alpha-mannosidase/mannosylglycerate hydrolase [Paenibacillus taihuensis]|uniref:Alpha-mannosidase/mannosylglycerate hydrolase n=1 Tax=Paenibacillus taihuensis TaxID=1156355 RepID=A0A3D9R148_9BACL|nr:glycoside hydrolase family 38 C-terminal domain-containing protein [Paenibacillus taihuensis]REE67958.1 alpha-mannosidase/mannosylglycerate hydrolase [Paenibacillus taihuensis]
MDTKKQTLDQSKQTIYYFSATHWDREWYQTFQGFRYRLVAMMNEMIEVLEQNPEFSVFHLDGQTIVLDDFLEIEPGKRERLAKLIADGRILIGPWYVMPDEFLLSGESLIRNLMIGHKTVAKWNVPVWKNGYICDIFGHIAQMPQIFAGFDIRHAVLGRGTNEHTTPAHLLWQSPDGTQCITYKLPDYGGYGALPHIFDNQYYEREWSREEKAERLKAFVDSEFARTELPVAVVMDGVDHEPIRKSTPELVGLLKELYPEADVKHVDLLEMAKQLEGHRAELPVRTGEIYEPAKENGPYVYVITHTLSSRYPLKKANDQNQTLLEKWVDPLVAVAAVRGYSLQKSYVDLAYQYLIQNHPHDSICGCSIDQVHKDMEYRFSQTEMIGGQLIADIMNHERSRFETAKDGADRLLTVWNPLPFARAEVITVDIDFPTAYPARYQEPFGYEEKNSFRVYDGDGREVPFGLVSMQKHKVVRIFNQVTERVDRHTITLAVEMPPMGAAVYRVVPSATPSRYLAKLSTGDRRAENERLRLVVNGDGTVSIYDKKTGASYDRLLSYLDDGEIGDGWFHVNPAEDRVVSSTGAPCTIEKVEDGPSRTVFRITHTLSVPESLDETKRNIRRSDRYRALRVVSLVGLSTGNAYVDVETTVDNSARDHRLRVLVPTGVAADSYFVNQPFAFVERPVGLRVDTQDWKECDVPEKQMGGIAGKRRADGSGLAFVSAYGLHECAAHDDEEGTLAVTLFRSFAKTVMTNGEAGGQILGEHQFAYRLALLDDAVTNADLVRLQDRLQAGFQASSVPVAAEYVAEMQGSFLELDSAHCCLSIMKRPESEEPNTVIVRLSNFSDAGDAAALRFERAIASASEVNLNEEDVCALPTDGSSMLKVEVPAWAIRTYRIRFE